MEERIIRAEFDQGTCFNLTFSKKGVGGIPLTQVATISCGGAGLGARRARA